MNQCRQHGTRLDDGTRIGHWWIVTEHATSNGGMVYKGVCKYCDRVKRFAHSPQPYISETARETIRYNPPAIQPVKVRIPVARIPAPVSDGVLTGSFSC